LKFYYTYSVTGTINSEISSSTEEEMRIVLGQEPELSIRLRSELAKSVNPLLDGYWSGVFSNGGTIPQEILRDPTGITRLTQELEVFGGFVGKVAEKVFCKEETTHANPQIVHYIGVGEGVDLRKVTTVANNLKMPVWAYDTATRCCKNAERVFEEIAAEVKTYPRANRVYRADIARACAEDVIVPERSKYLFLVRVLEVLDKPLETLGEPDPEITARVCQSIGELIRQGLKVVEIGARPEHNLGVSFSNTKPKSVKTLAGFMELGANRKILAWNIDECQHFKHRYSATLFS
jgi:hypothetical protein